MGMLTWSLEPVVHGIDCAVTACMYANAALGEEVDRQPAVQANAQLDGLGNHSKLYEENDQAEREQRKLSREQASLVS